MDCWNHAGSIDDHNIKDQVMDFVVILGGGESGVGTALLAKKEGIKVFVSDYGVIKEHFKKELTKNKIRFEEGGHDFEIIRKASTVVKSPGIPEKAEIVQKIRKESTEIISEIEFGFRFCSSRIIGITGSNGKTTTTSLIYHLMKSSGVNVEVCGNIGKSFARVLAEQEKADWYVIEISSFQLDDIKSFRPDIGILLNITADHLDRYEYKLENYALSKCRIAANQTHEDVLIYNANDRLIENYFNELSHTNRLISIEVSERENEALTTSQGYIFDMMKFPLSGKHNVFNAKCSIEAALEAGVSKEDVQMHLNTFQNVAHRLETVAAINGVLYVNDSKATNVDAVYYALDAYDENIIWIAGGTDKGNDYSQIKDLVNEKVKTLICLGIDNQKLLNYFSGTLQNIKETQDINEAVELASKEADLGDVVLLSPACASFDLFQNYEHRGQQFKQAVFRLLNP